MIKLALRIVITAKLTKIAVKNAKIIPLDANSFLVPWLNDTKIIPVNANITPIIINKSIASPRNKKAKNPAKRIWLDTIAAFLEGPINVMPV